MKRYRGHVQFVPQSIVVSASNLREAKVKIRQKALAATPKIDALNFFVDDEM